MTGTRQRPLSLALVLALLMAGFGRAAGEETLRVGEVRVRSLDVFSPEEAGKGWFYRTANAIHMETRTSVIRKFLLFQTGDPYDRFMLEQTERNLRQLRFIKSASVTAGPPHDGVVDVDVVTQDSWTLDPGVSLGGRGGAVTWSIALQERNILGSGKEVGFTYDKENERTIRFLEFHDPALFAAYWTTDLTWAQNTDGSQERAVFAKSFVSFADPYAAGLLYNHLRFEQDIYAVGDPLSRYSLDRRQFRLDYARAIEAGDTFARRVGLAFDYLDERYRPTTVYPVQIVPGDHTFRYFSVFYQEESNDFLKLNYVNRDLRYEDFNLGLTLGGAFAVSPHALGAPRTTFFVRAGAGGGLRLGKGSFLLGRVDFQTRLDSGPKNSILSASLGWVRKWDTQLLQTTVSRLRLDYGWSLDQNVQFFADGTTGLRGYRLHAFEGNKRLIWNLEHRVFSGKEILQLFSPGLAVFLDTGLAANTNVPIRLVDFKTDIGLGLRFGIARAAGNDILRLDLAYGLNSDQKGKKGWLVSFSSGQSF